MIDRLTQGAGRVGRRLGRPDILFWILPWLMILLVWGTVAQKDMGLYEAQHRYFSSFWFMWNGLPLPGVYAVLTVMSVNLLCKFLFLSPWRRDKAGIHIIHLAVIVLLGGGLVTALTIKEGFMVLQIGDSRAEMGAFEGGEMFIRPDLSHDGAVISLPFALRLDNFRRTAYPGTTMARSFESYVTVIDGAMEFPALIAMNEPLRYGGYTFYQASTFIDSNGRPVSILHVATNEGWIFPYISGVLLAAGLGLHLVIRLRALKPVDDRYA